MNSTQNITPETSGDNKKKRSYKKLIIPFIAVVIVITSVCGIVVAKKKFRDGPHGFFIEKMTENLNLSENQKAQVERIKTQIREQMEANKSGRENHMEEFANEFKKDKLDMSTLMELKKKKEQKKEEIDQLIMDKIIEFHDILTPEQRSQVVENMKEMKKNFHDRTKKFQDKKD